MQSSTQKTKSTRRRVFILTSNPFPVGNVATNRFSTYAKVLASRGCDVKVLILKGTEDPASPINKNRLGVFEGVRYEYMSRDSTWNTKAPQWKKAVLYFFGIVRAVQCLAKERPSSVILYTNDLLYMALFGFVARLVRFRYVIDKSEYPVVYRRRKSLYRSLYLKTFRLFDGILVMTEELKSFYSSIKQKQCELFLLPMSVDLSRFSSARKIDGVGPYFGCVFGVHNRDCIADTIKAFYLFCSEHPTSDVRLKLIGDIESLAGRDEVLRVYESSEYRARVEFLGTVVATEVPSFLTSAIALITTPREYVSGGFPTKLGEYLATGNPVIATAAGEVSNYLEDSKNCFLAQPADVRHLADLMRVVWSSPEFVRTVGAAGKCLASDVFSVESYADDLIEFLLK
ncbi:glycosyltransferase family 4 protein [Zoogloea sp.]|uniref:glycosyltransferase family 4 protein n=1 Tax=Zoogloea sp. TaxID=49181 RepID=UPI0035B1547F